MHFVLPLVALCVPAVQRRAPQSPPSNVYKRGGGLGGLLGFGWVGASKPQNPPAPYKHSLPPPPPRCVYTQNMHMFMEASNVDKRRERCF